MKGLKIVLTILGALTVAKSLFGLLAPWSDLARWVEAFGFQALPADPVVVYTFRLVSLCFLFTGLFFFVLARNPLRYLPLLALSVWGLLALAAGALVGGALLRLPPPSYLAGVAGCLVAAVLLLAFWPTRTEKPSAA